MCTPFLPELGLGLLCVRYHHLVGREVFSLGSPMAHGLVLDVRTDLLGFKGALGMHFVG